MVPTRSCQDEGGGEWVRGNGGGGSDLWRTGVGLEVFLVGKKDWLDWVGVGEVGEKGKRGRTVDFFRRECEGLQF